MFRRQTSCDLPRSPQMAEHKLATTWVSPVPQAQLVEAGLRRHSVSSMIIDWATCVNHLPKMSWSGWSTFSIPVRAVNSDGVIFLKLRGSRSSDVYIPRTDTGQDEVSRGYCSAPELTWGSMVLAPRGTWVQKGRRCVCLRTCDFVTEVEKWQWGLWKQFLGFWKELDGGIMMRAAVFFMGRLLSTYSSTNGIKCWGEDPQRRLAGHDG